MENVVKCRSAGITKYHKPRVREYRQSAATPQRTDNLCSIPTNWNSPPQYRRRTLLIVHIPQLLKMSPNLLPKPPLDICQNRTNQTKVITQESFPFPCIADSLAHPRKVRFVFAPQPPNADRHGLVVACLGRKGQNALEQVCELLSQWRGRSGCCGLRCGGRGEEGGAAGRFCWE
jgi:hypothetical protein